MPSGTAGRRCCSTTSPLQCAHRLQRGEEEATAEKRPLWSISSTANPISWCNLAHERDASTIRRLPELPRKHFVLKIDGEKESSPQQPTPDRQLSDAHFRSPRRKIIEVVQCFSDSEKCWRRSSGRSTAGRSERRCRVLWRGGLITLSMIVTPKKESGVVKPPHSQTYGRPHCSRIRLAPNRPSESTRHVLSDPSRSQDAVDVDMARLDERLDAADLRPRRTGSRQIHVLDVRLHRLRVEARRSPRPRSIRCCELLEQARILSISRQQEHRIARNRLGHLAFVAHMDGVLVDRRQPHARHEAASCFRGRSSAEAPRWASATA